MGVPSLYNYLTSTYRITTTPKHSCILYLDFNSIIHNSIRTTEAVLFKNIGDYLDLLIEKTNPQYVYISVDGRAPISKVLQQRCRRHMKEGTEGNEIWPYVKENKNKNMSKDKNMSNDKNRNMSNDSCKNYDGKNKDGKNLSDSQNKDGKNKDGKNYDCKNLSDKNYDSKNYDSKNHDSKNKDGKNSPNKNPLNKNYDSVNSLKEDSEWEEINSTNKIDIFDGNSITPGTPFMSRLDTFMHSYIQNALNSSKYTQLIIYSSSKTSGEGEQKILRHLNTHSLSSSIYSPDADLLFLTLQCNDTFIIREPHGKCTKCHKQHKLISCENVRRTQLVSVDINLLKTYLVNDTTKYINFKFNNERILADICFVNFLCGNDFIPRLLCFDVRFDGVGLLLEKLGKFYKKTGKYIIKKRNSNTRENIRENTRENPRENTRENTRENIRQNTRENPRENTRKNSRENLSENIRENTSYKNFYKNTYDPENISYNVLDHSKNSYDNIKNVDYSKNVNTKSINKGYKSFDITKRSKTISTNFNYKNTNSTNTSTNNFNYKISYEDQLKKEHLFENKLSDADELFYIDYQLLKSFLEFLEKDEDYLYLRKEGLLKSMRKRYNLPNEEEIDMTKTDGKNKYYKEKLFKIINECEMEVSKKIRTEENNNNYNENKEKLNENLKKNSQDFKESLKDLKKNSQDSKESLQDPKNFKDQKYGFSQTLESNQLNSEKTHGSQLNSEKIHDSKINSEEIHDTQLNSEKTHDINVNSEKNLIDSRDSNLVYKDNLFINAQNLFDNDYTELRIKAGYEYMKGLTWLTSLYLNNNVISWTWFYPYHYPPLLNDLLLSKDTYFEFYDDYNLSLLQQAVSVLPLASKHNVPFVFNTLLKEYKIEIDMFDKLLDWQGVPLIPFCDFKECHKEYQNIVENLYKRCYKQIKDENTENKGEKANDSEKGENDYENTEYKGENANDSENNGEQDFEKGENTGKFEYVKDIQDNIESKNEYNNFKSKNLREDLSLPIEYANPHSSSDFTDDLRIYANDDKNYYFDNIQDMRNFYLDICYTNTPGDDILFVHKSHLLFSSIQKVLEGQKVDIGIGTVEAYCYGNVVDEKNNNNDGVMTVKFNNKERIDK